MSGKTRDELVAELREYGFDEQAEMLEQQPAEVQKRTTEQGLRRSIQEIATSKQPRAVGSVRDVLRGEVGDDETEEEDQ